MQHGKKKFKLSRTHTHRDAALANMAAALFLHSKITTTSPKAKALRPLVDRLIATAKQGTLHSKREVASRVPHKEALKKLFQEIVPKFEDRASGFSRVVKAGFRKGDNAEMSVVELLFAKQEVVEEKKESRLKKISGKLRRPTKSAAKHSASKPKAKQAATAKTKKKAAAAKS